MLQNKCFAFGVFRAQSNTLGQKSFVICKFLCSEIKSKFFVFWGFFFLVFFLVTVHASVTLIAAFGSRLLKKKNKSLNSAYEASWEKDKPDYGVFLSMEKGECLLLPVVIMQLNERGRISMEKYPGRVTEGVYRREV